MLCTVLSAVNCEFLFYSKTTFAQLLTKIFQKGIFCHFCFISIPFGFKTFALFSTSLFSRCCDILEIHSFCQNQMVTWNTILLYHHLIWKLGFMKIRVCYYRHLKASLLWMFQLKSNKLVHFSAQKLCNCCAALSNVGQITIGLTETHACPVKFQSLQGPTRRCHWLDSNIATFVVILPPLII